MRYLAAVAALGLVLAVTGTAGAVSVFQSGGDRLVATQGTDGGWGWPLTAPPTYGNLIGPIGMGLAKAYGMTGDPAHLTALQNAAAYLQTQTMFSPSAGYVAAELDKALGGTANVDYVKANYYDQLAAGTYDRYGTLYDTASYVAQIRADRQAQGIANMAAWDIGIGVAGAASVGASTSEWVAGTKAEIDELDGDQYYDVLGLAGSVYGLAIVGEDFDPTAGEHAAAGSLSDLAAILAGYQIGTGGFTWNSNYMTAGNETAQETAYAILALDAFSRATYLSEIQSAGQWLEGSQLATGGWDNYLGDPDGENNEITGEALWGIRTAVPEPVTMAGLVLGIGSLATYLRRRRAA